jgi:hypothetical protein
MRPKRDKTGDAVDRPTQGSSLSSDPSAKFFCEKGDWDQKEENRARTKALPSPQETRDETMTNNGNETMLNINRAPP